MNLLKDDPKKLYRNYLTASIGSAVVMSVYSFVDTVAIGQSEGPAGTAAMAVVTPLCSILVVLSTLCGIGGSALLGKARGEKVAGNGNDYFTAALLLVTVLALFIWISLGLLLRPLLHLFGADDGIMPMAIRYAKWIVWFCPVFIFPAFLSSFLRNDGVPGLAMGAVITGGCLNVLGDWLLVFPFKMGIEGAAVATVISSSTQILIMCSHFLRRKCTLRFTRPKNTLKTIKQVFCTGFSSGILDFGTVILNCLINHQIMLYGGAAALSVYGVIAIVAALFQALFSGIGQAIQPIVSTNFGAGLTARIRKTMKMAVMTATVMGILFTGIGEFFPIPMIRLFMSATPEVLRIAPGIIRIYFSAFLFMGINITFIYYFQSIMDEKKALTLALMRSIGSSGLLLLVLPLLWDITGVWLAVPVSELIVVLSIFYLQRLPNTRAGSE